MMKSMGKSEIDILIDELPSVLKESNPAILVDWVTRYAQEGESCFYGSDEQRDKVASLFEKRGIVKEQHLDKCEDGMMKSGDPKIVAEFIAGQLLKFSLHPRYFLACASYFDRKFRSDNGTSK